MKHTLESIFANLYKTIEIDKHNYNSCKKREIKHYYKKILINRLRIIEDIIEDIRKKYSSNELTVEQYRVEVSNINQKLFNEENLNRELLITMTELSKYDGVTYESKYICVNKIIYDVTASSFLQCPQHTAVPYGKDVSQFFEMYHGANKEILNSLYKVGKLKE